MIGHRPKTGAREPLGHLERLWRGEDPAKVIAELEAKAERTPQDEKALREARVLLEKAGKK